LIPSFDDNPSASLKMHAATSHDTVEANRCWPTPMPTRSSPSITYLATPSASSGINISPIAMLTVSPTPTSSSKVFQNSPSPLRSTIAPSALLGAAKIREAAKCKDDSGKATACFQGLSVEFSFIVQTSKNTKHLEEHTGLNSKACYVTITNHHSCQVQGSNCRSKEPPVKWLDCWLARNAPNVPDKHVLVMNQGGELGHCPEILATFAKHHCAVCLTGAGASYQNGPSERPHQTVGNAVRAMLLGGAWPQSFALCF
jgi:hypothetical protein